jgi:prolyl oligopeptidase
MVRNTGDNQARLEITRRDGSGRRVLYDPAGASVPQAVDWFSLSEDGRYIIFGVSQQGDEWTVLRLYDTESGRMLPEEIPGTRWASVAMPAGGESLYYTRYPLDGNGAPQFYHQRVFCHRLGTDYRADAAIYADSEKTATFSLFLSEDGMQLLIETQRGWSANRLTLRSVAGPGQKAEDIILFDSTHERIEPFWHEGAVYGLHQSPDHAGRIVRWDIKQKSWTTVVEEYPDQPLQACLPSKGGLLLLRLHEARALLQWRSDENSLVNIALPHEGIGSVLAVETDPCGEQAYLGWTSFDQPRQVLELSTKTREMVPFGEYVASVADISIWQEWAPSVDGTKIPVFFAKKGPKPTAPVPAVVGGYGGLKLSQFYKYPIPREK